MYELTIWRQFIVPGTSTRMLFAIIDMARGRRRNVIPANQMHLSGRNLGNRRQFVDHDSLSAM